ncbi:LysR family transcriptional regulator [Pseudomonas sp. PCH446]
MDYFAALTAFVEAAQANNFSRAAEKLSIKASTVSRYIKDLEQDLGIALFNRSTRTLRLTEGGETFLHHALRVLAELDQARAATSALNQQPRGCSNSTCHRPLPGTMCCRCWATLPSALRKSAWS